MQSLKDGRTSTEWKLALFAHGVALALLLGGSVLLALGNAGGLALLVVGALLMLGSGAVYTMGRSRAKAAASAPQTVTRVQAGRLGL